MLKHANRVRARLAALERALALTAQQRVVRAAEEARDGARARAPVDSGALRESIEVCAEGLKARVVTECPYAAAVEFGTSRRAPKPFMRG